MITVITVAAVVIVMAVDPVLRTVAKRRVCSSMNTHLQHTLYYAQIYKHPLLKDDIAHYLRKPEWPYKRTYAWLHDVLVENKLMQDIEEQHTTQT